MSPSYVILVPSGLVLFFAFRIVLRRLRSHSLAHLPGPEKRSSWLVGNLPELVRPAEIGDADMFWTREYGTTIRIKGTFGALRYIFNASGYNYPKPEDFRASVALMGGKGLSWAEGSQHARQKRIMNPAFSLSSLRAFLPVFSHFTQKMVLKLKEEIQEIQGNENTSTVLDIFSWLSRTALDSIGAAGFDYQFNAIDQKGESELAKAYNNFFSDFLFDLPDSMIVFGAIMGIVPQWMRSFLSLLPNERMNRIRNYMSVARDVAKEIIDKQTDIYSEGKEGSKDIMSILVRANRAEDPNAKLSEEEILSQLTTIIFAGHESTSTTIAWALYELARHPEYQTRVRDEIRVTRAQAAQRGKVELTIPDLDSMPYLLALETLRFHPIIPHLIREARRDDMIPLETPITTKVGQVITSIPVSRGQRVYTSFVAYNRLKSVWGEDADKWRPERFIEDTVATQNTGLGVFANVITFGGGVKSCIGWRFAVLEMQTILIEILESFEFSPPPGNIEIIRGAAGIMSPMVKGSVKGRSELPITITPL
ncbi:cytochrome P450 [Hysterangium stoloniferum]|nr:cytochrome P450 [Hysterangium stoloniferum]